MSVMESARCAAPDDFLTGFELEPAHAFTTQCWANFNKWQIKWQLGLPVKHLCIFYLFVMF